MYIVMPSRANKAVEEVVAALDSSLLRALAEPARLEILKLLLVNGRSDMSTLAEQLVQDRSVVSRHIKLLADVGVVSIEREGRHRFVTLQGASVVARLRKLVQTIEAAVAACCPQGPRG